MRLHAMHMCMCASIFQIRDVLVSSVEVIMTCSLFNQRPKLH